MCLLHHYIFHFFLSGTRELAVHLVGTAAVSDPAAVCQPAMVLLEATFPPHQQQPPSSTDSTMNDLPPRHIKREELTPLAAPQHSWSRDEGLKSSGLEAGRTPSREEDGGPIEGVHATKEELSWEMTNIGKYTYTILVIIFSPSENFV
jgi:hypothetical protein